MTAARAYIPFDTPSGSARARRAVRGAALPLLVAGVVFATCTFANVPGAWLDGAAEGAGSEAPFVVHDLPLVAQLGPLAVAREPSPRCESCGIVTGIRRIEPAGGQPEAFEFTVRLRGGVMTTRRMASVGTWRSGDTIILLGGVADASAVDGGN